MPFNFTFRANTKKPLARIDTPSLNNGFRLDTNAGPNSLSSSGGGLSSAPDIVTASELMLAYFRDSAVADYHYKDKVLEVTGKVNSKASSAAMLNITMTSESTHFDFYINCQVPNTKKQTELFNGITAGKTVTIRGTCKGYGQNITLENCEILDRPFT